MGCGVSTNTRAELLALWALLVFADTIGLPSLFVCGDSQVIINWENSIVHLDVVDLDHWCDHIDEVKASFLSINLKHIYREHNQSVDSLSKESLSLEMQKLSYEEFLDGESIRRNIISFF